MGTRLLSCMLATAACAFLSAAPAGATIYIQLANADTNGGVLTTVATGTTSASFSGVYGDYNIQNITASDIFPIDLGTNTFDVAATPTANPLFIMVTETPITNVPGEFLSTLTENNLSSGWTVEETTWVNSTELFADTFSGVGSTQQLNAASVTSPFSLSEEFMINPNGAAGQDQSTESIIGAPEPSTWAMFCVGFAGLGMLRLTNPRRKEARYAI